jgi:hypothetical protein
MLRQLALIPLAALALALVLVPRTVVQGTELAAVPAAPLAVPIGTAFTYQGQLKQGGVPVNGTCDVRFRLFDAAAGGVQIGPDQTPSGVTLTNGLFTVTLDFGATAFTGEARWLEIAPACPPGSGFATLSPRQPLTPTPDALFARHNWSLTGNLGTTPATSFLGTTDNQALELKVNNLRALRLEPNGTSANVVGGFSGNSATGAFGATIGGGGQAGFANQATANFATVGGGDNNTASGLRATIAGGGTNCACGARATIGGGVNNQASGNEATVGGGELNVASGARSTVGGGSNNVAGPFNESTVAGGELNIAAGARATVSGGRVNVAGGGRATIGGGQGNQALGNQSTIAGGESNVAIGTESAVGGGEGNQALGSRATIPGGQGNIAGGDRSFAAGRRAQANHDGVFIWGDNTNADIASTVANEFTARTSGGARFFSDAAATVGVSLPPGGGAWVAISDRAAKTDFASVDAQAILEAVAALPVETWSYATQDPAIRHIGPTAQEFAASFGVGDDPRGINTVDADGVALAAIQALYQRVQEKDAALAAQQQQVTTLEARLVALERALGQPAAVARP